MFPQSIDKHLKSLAAGAMIVTLMSVFITRAASARVAANTIDPVAVVTESGRELIVSGPIACTSGERAFLTVTLTQRSTGAVAEGRTIVTCNGEDQTQQWEAQVSTQGNASFEPGPATAVAVGRTTAKGDATDAHQWLVNITLVNE